MVAPAIPFIPTVALFLSSIFLLILPPLPLIQQQEIIINSWNEEYVYEASINGEPAVIYLESEIEPEKPESEHHPKAGKIKIIFKESKQLGTTFIYERDMADGEISEVDQAYIEKVLTSVEKFHADNNTLDGKIKDTIQNFFKSIKKKR